MAPMGEVAPGRLREAVLAGLPLSPKALFAIEFIDLEKATGVEGAIWEENQVGFLNNQARFGLDVKARQIGWSFTAAVDAVIDSIFNPDTPHIFVSINQEEAKEKIRYAKAIVAAIDQPVRPVLKHETDLSLEFVNGSRLISHPCKPVRGRARARIYLDEIAHYVTSMDREIYTAALPATLSGQGYIRLGSSPLGQRGIFWEIFSEALRPYPGYRDLKRELPWWTVRYFTRGTPSREEVANLTSEDRVDLFGSVALVELFENMFLEDFQQECECAFGLEEMSWISWELIQENQDSALWFRRARSVEEGDLLIEELQRAIDRGEIEGVFCGGIDMGRKKDLTECSLLGRAPDGSARGETLSWRGQISLFNVRFDDQEEFFVRMIEQLPLTAVCVDETGLGMHLAENLAGRTGRALPCTFTNPNKELWAVEARLAMQRGQVRLPVDREISYQIHSIRKRISGRHAVFDPESSDQHHADIFWSWALGIAAAAIPSPSGPLGSRLGAPVSVEEWEIIPGLSMTWGGASNQSEFVILSGQVVEGRLLISREYRGTVPGYRGVIEAALAQGGSPGIAFVESQSLGLRAVLTDLRVVNGKADTKVFPKETLEGMVQELQQKNLLVIHSRCGGLKRSLLRRNLSPEVTDVFWKALYSLVRAIG